MESDLQRDLFSGRDARDAGLEQVKRNERERWWDAAIRIGREMRGDFIGEDARIRIHDEIGPPHHPNVYGALTNQLVREGSWVKTQEWRPMAVKSSHARMSRVYRSRKG